MILCRLCSSWLPRGSWLRLFSWCVRCLIVGCVISSQHGRFHFDCRSDGFLHFVVCIVVSVVVGSWCPDAGWPISMCRLLFSSSSSFIWRQNSCSLACRGLLFSIFAVVNAHNPPYQSNVSPEHTPFHIRHNHVSIPQSREYHNLRLPRSVVCSTG